MSRANAATLLVERIGPLLHALEHDRAQVIKNTVSSPRCNSLYARLCKSYPRDSVVDAGPMSGFCFLEEFLNTFELTLQPPGIHDAYRNFGRAEYAYNKLPVAVDQFNNKLYAHLRKLTRDDSEAILEPPGAHDAIMKKFGYFKKLNNKYTIDGLFESQHNRSIGRFRKQYALIKKELLEIKPTDHFHALLQKVSTEQGKTTGLLDELMTFLDTHPALISLINKHAEFINQFYSCYAKRRSSGKSTQGTTLPMLHQGSFAKSPKQDVIPKTVHLPSLTSRSARP